jgi:hypothetical protein
VLLYVPALASLTQPEILFNRFTVIPGYVDLFITKLVGLRWLSLLGGPHRGRSRACVVRDLYSQSGIAYCIKGFKSHRRMVLSRRPPSRLDLARQTARDLMAGVISEAHVNACIEERLFRKRTWRDALRLEKVRVLRVRGSRGKYIKRERWTGVRAAS